MAPERRVYVTDNQPCGEGIDNEYCPGFRFGIDDGGCCTCTKGGKKKR